MRLKKEQEEKEHKKKEKAEAHLYTIIKVLAIFCFFLLSVIYSLYPKPLVLVVISLDFLKC
jgi:Na+/citrate or Na+/malate symporter